MKIVIAGGRVASDFLIPLLVDKKHEVIVINNDKSYCEHLSAVHEIPIVYGDACKEYVLRDADIYDSDILIALKNSDADNLAVCQMAKRIFNVRKNICTVSNPKNVDVFKKLGINTAISDAYVLAKLIEKATSLEDLAGDIIERILEE